MGSCVSSKKKTENQILLINSRQKFDPNIFLIENFKIVDFTGQLNSISDISEVKPYFMNYIANDFRCVKGTQESKHDHSHLVTSFIHSTRPQVFSEISLITDYSRYGFSVSIGPTDLVTKYCNIAGAKLELLHLPKADNHVQIGIYDIIEWAYEHKDELYMNPHKIPEFNMGKRIYIHFVSMLSILNQYRV